MVYRHFINYPSLTVFENIASPLRVQGKPRAEIEQQLAESPPERAFRELTIWRVMVGHKREAHLRGVDQAIRQKRQAGSDPGLFLVCRV